MYGVICILKGLHVVVYKKYVKYFYIFYIHYYTKNIIVPGWYAKDVNMKNRVKVHVLLLQNGAISYYDTCPIRTSTRRCDSELSFLRCFGLTLWLGVLISFRKYCHLLLIMQ